MEIMHASHCTYRIRYHMIFVVKYRKKMLLERTRIEFLKELCVEIGKRYWFEFDAIGVDGDHFHVVVGAAPRHSPSSIMQAIKSITAKQIFERYPYLRDELWGGEFWSDGGHIDTVGHSGGLEVIKRYVENQGKKNEEDRTQLSLLSF